jgi:hypothetical protein
MSAIDSLLPEIEWEPLLKPWSGVFAPGGMLGPCLQTFEVSRGGDWRLSGQAAGRRPPDFKGAALPRYLTRPGELIPAMPIIDGMDVMQSARIQMRDVYVDGETTTSDGEVSARLSMGYVIIDLGPSSLGDTRARIWFLNGPGPNDLTFVRRTERSCEEHYRRERGSDCTEVRALRGTETATDYIHVPLPDAGIGQAIFASAPKGLVADDLKPCSVEFRLADPAHRPEWTELEFYRDALSFALGRQLLPIGLSLFDGRAQPIFHNLRSGWPTDLHAACRRPSQPLTVLGTRWPGTQQEETLSRLVSGFSATATTYNLRAALSALWIADASIIDSELIHLAASLECIVTAWFKSTNTKSGGKYMPQAEWEGLATEPLAALKRELEGTPERDRILRRAWHANNYGSNERFERFFAELNLPVGDVEIAAIAARNKAAHGGTYTPAEYSFLHCAIAAYRTLIHRVMLRLIGWAGEYIDYSTYGFPNRALEAPLGGPEGDHKPAEPP